MSDDYIAEAPLTAPERFRRILDRIPPHAEEADERGIGAEAAAAAIRRSEARRDAILAVALAIKRRGQNPLMDWSTRDTDTAYAIADQLIALS
jgi:hypothetical protein